MGPVSEIKMNTKEVWMMILEYSAKFQHMDSFHVLHEVCHSKPLEDYLPTPTSGFLLPSQRNHLDDILLAPANVYHIMSTEDVSKFAMAADLLHQIYNHEPRCCGYRKFYRLLLGIKMKMLVEALRKGSDRLLGEFNKHMPRDGFHHQSEDSHDREKINGTIKEFRRFFLPLILDREAREKYFSSQYETEFGDTYMKHLTELTKSVLTTMMSHLPPCRLEVLFSKEQIPVPVYQQACPALKILLNFIQVTEKLDGQSLMKLLKLLADQDQLPARAKEKLLKSVRVDPKLMQRGTVYCANSLESSNTFAAEKKPELVEDTDIEPEQCIAVHHDSNGNRESKASDHKKGSFPLDFSNLKLTDKENDLKDQHIEREIFVVKHRFSYTGCKPKLSACKHPDLSEKTSGKSERIQDQTTLLDSLETKCRKKYGERIFLDSLDTKCQKNRRQTILLDPLDTKCQGDPAKLPTSDSKCGKECRIMQEYQENGLGKNSYDTNNASFQEFPVKSFYSKSHTANTVTEINTAVSAGNVFTQIKPSTTIRCLKDSLVSSNRILKESTSEYSDDDCLHKGNKSGGKVRKKQRSVHMKVKKCARKEPRWRKSKMKKCMRCLSSLPPSSIVTRSRQRCKSDDTYQVKCKAETDQGDKSHKEIVTVHEQETENDENNTHAKSKKTETMCSVDYSTGYSEDTTSTVNGVEKQQAESICEGKASRSNRFSHENVNSTDMEDTTSTVVGFVPQQAQSFCKRITSNMSSLESNYLNDFEDVTSQTIGYDSKQNFTDIEDIAKTRVARIASWCDANIPNLGMDRDCALQTVGCTNLLSLDRTAQEEDSQIHQGQIEIRCEGWEVHSIVAPSVRSEEGSDMQLEVLEEDLEFEDNKEGEIIPDFRKFLISDKQGKLTADSWSSCVKLGKTTEDPRSSC